MIPTMCYVPDPNMASTLEVPKFLHEKSVYLGHGMMAPSYESQQTSHWGCPEGDTGE